MFLRKNKGFTLIELLVVIAIIGILAALIIVSLVGAQNRARDTQRKNNARNLDSALAQYYLDNSSVYPFTSTVTDATNGISIGTSSACTAPLAASLVGTTAYLSQSTACGDPSSLTHLYKTDGTGSQYAIAWQLANQGGEAVVTAGNGVYAVASGVVDTPTVDYTAASAIGGVRAFVVYGPQ